MKKIIIFAGLVGSLLGCGGDEKAGSVARGLTGGEKAALMDISEKQDALSGIDAAEASYSDSELSDNAKFVKTRIEETCTISSDPDLNKVSFSGENCVVPFESQYTYDNPSENNSSTKRISAFEVKDQQIVLLTGVQSGSMNGQSLTAYNPKTRKGTANLDDQNSFIFRGGLAGYVNSKTETFFTVNEEQNDIIINSLFIKFDMLIPPYKFIITAKLDSSGAICSLNGEPINCPDLMDAISGKGRIESAFKLFIANLH